MTNFDIPWCRELFARPDFEMDYYPGRQPPPPADKRGRFSLFSETFWTERTIRAWCPFTLDNPSNKVFPYTYCLLVALGDGLDMTTSNLTGGIAATIIDVAISLAAVKAHGAPITIKLALDFKHPVITPCVLICKVHVTKIEKRRCFAESTLEDGKGEVFVSATSTFVRPPGEEGRRVAEGLMAVVNKDWGLVKPRI